MNSMAAMRLRCGSIRDRDSLCHDGFTISQRRRNELREREERRSAHVASAHADVESAHAVIPKKAEY
jgi:hypothetical protein